jgi:hypothetical protein
MKKETKMEKLAKAILALDWSDMDDFAQEIVSAATDDNGEPNEERYISQALIQWARDLVSEKI